MKRIVMAALLLMGTTTMAQNGTYKVTNKHELTTTVLEERLSSSQYNITPEKPGTSLIAEGVDTATLMNVLAEYLLQENPVAAEEVAGPIPAQVTVDEKNVTITGEKGDTIRAYAVREIKGGGTQWTLLCEDNVVIRFYDLKNGRYTLTVPKMERLELRKVK